MKGFHRGAWRNFVTSITFPNAEKPNTSFFSWHTRVCSNDLIHSVERTN